MAGLEKHYSAQDIEARILAALRVAGKRLRLRHRSPECRKLITTAGHLVVIEEAEDDPHDFVARL